jgi:catalase
MMQDGFGQGAILAGRARYSPNSLGGGCPFTSTMAQGGYVHSPRVVEGTKVRGRAEPQPDYFTQATMFWNSMSEPERDHVAGAFSFELGKVEVAHVRERMVQNLAEVHPDLVERVAAALGMQVPPEPQGLDTSIPSSPALSQLPAEPCPVHGRLVAVLAADGADAVGVKALGAACTAAGARAVVVAPRLGVILGDDGVTVPAAKAFLTAQSVEFDVVVVAGGSGAEALAIEPFAAVFVQEAYRHHKTIAGWGRGVDTLRAFNVPLDAPGVATAEAADTAFGTNVLQLAGWHRHWERPALVALPQLSAV